MDEAEAKKLVEDPVFFKQMLELNYSGKYSSVDNFALSNVFSQKKVNLIANNHLQTLALRKYFYSKLPRQVKNSNFIILKNDFDKLLLIDISLLKLVVKAVGCCVLSRIFIQTAEKSKKDLFEQIVGKNLLTFVLNYGRYAPYDKDLGISDDLVNSLVSYDDLQQSITEYGIFAMICISSSFSEELYRNIFFAKLFSLFGQERVEILINKSSNLVCNVKRIYSLIKKIMKEDAFFNE